MSAVCVFCMRHARSSAECACSAHRITRTIPHHQALQRTSRCYPTPKPRLASGYSCSTRTMHPAECCPKVHRDTGIENQPVRASQI
eukprot:2934609-Rhodomonas_salina.3